jgi:hypothetical protein
MQKTPLTVLSIAAELYTCITLPNLCTILVAAHLRPSVFGQAPSKRHCNCNADWRSSDSQRLLLPRHAVSRPIPPLIDTAGQTAILFRLCVTPEATREWHVQLSSRNLDGMVTVPCRCFTLFNFSPLYSSVMPVRTTAVKREVDALTTHSHVVLHCSTTPYMYTQHEMHHTLLQTFCSSIFLIAAGAYLQGVYRFGVVCPNPIILYHPFCVNRGAIRSPFSTGRSCSPGQDQCRCT